MEDCKDIDQLASELASSLSISDSESNKPEKVKSNKKDKKKKLRCNHPGCKKKLRMIYDFPCKCKKYFCKKHKDSEIHNCTYDHKGEYRKKLEKENPLVMFSKVDKIISSKKPDDKDKKDGKPKKIGIMDFMKFI